MINIKEILLINLSMNSTVVLKINIMYFYWLNIMLYKILKLLMRV